jgi:carbamoyltransferase
MITWGINALNHDASIAVVSDTDLKFWKRSSEYSGITGDDQINGDLIRDAFRSANDRGPDQIIWYERPWLKKTRQAYAGQWGWALDLDELPTRYLKKFNLGYAKISYMPHHLSHAAAGFLTSPFDEATVVVLDAIGEWESATIWKGKGTRLKKVWSRSYPTSLGLFYSAFTHLIGLTPIREEHKLQQLSGQGDSNRFYEKIKSYWRDDWTIRTNLHKGVRDWGLIAESDSADIAAAAQRVFEEKADEVMRWAKVLTSSDNLVYMGGCAMNSKFNTRLPEQWQGIWSLPIPGDSSSSIGAVLYKKQMRMRWDMNLAKHVPLVYNKL